MKGRDIFVGVAAWLLINVTAYGFIERRERHSLEKTHGLRSGILSEFQSRTLTMTDDRGIATSIRYRVLEPDGSFVPHSLPIVLYLHGSGERGWDNAAPLKHLPSLLLENSYRKTHPCLLIVPQCPPDINWTGFRSCFKNHSKSALLNDQRDPVLCILDRELQDPRADPRRVALVGYSMGSFGAWQLAADHPEYFSAVVPIAGGGSVELAQRLTGVPIWAIHGLDDNICDPGDTIALVNAIREADASAPIRMTCISDVGHDVLRPALGKSSEVMDWIFSQSKLQETNILDVGR